VKHVFPLLDVIIFPPIRYRKEAKTIVIITNNKTQKKKKKEVAFKDRFVLELQCKQREKSMLYAMLKISTL